MLCQGTEPVPEGTAGSQLRIATGTALAFGLIDVSELENRALGVVRAVEDELMEEAASWWVEMSSGR